jgi:methionyl-tRNA formyltransferase
MTIRVIFMGSPEFSIPTLQTLVTHYQVVGAVSQPDRPAGRGRALTPPPGKVLAQVLGVPVIQPRRLREPEAMDQLHKWNPDLIVVAAFGQILRPDVLDMPRFGCINVHASLLPRWRGAAPIQAAILSGDTQTGITIMKMDPGVDTGPILSQRSLPILPEDTAESLSQRLSHLGAELLIETLPAYLRGDLMPTAQPPNGDTYAPMLKKEDGLLNFNQPVEDIVRRVRAFYPWPGAYTLWKGEILKIHRAHALLPSPIEVTPAQPAIVEGLPAFGASDGLLVIEELQPAGKKPMPGEAFLRGAREWAS